MNDLKDTLQVGLANGLIDIDDAIDIREVRNLKTANQLLKLAKRKKFEREQQANQANIQAQAEANQQNQQMAAQMEMQKSQVIAQSEKDLEGYKAGLASKALIEEVELKKELMALEFEFALKLKAAETMPNARDDFQEGRKDQRELLKENNKREMHKEKMSASKFESSGNDTTRSGVGLGNHGPR